MWCLSVFSVSSLGSVQILNVPPKDMYVNWTLGVDEWLSHYVGSVIDL